MLSKRRCKRKRGEGRGESACTSSRPAILGRPRGASRTRPGIPGRPPRGYGFMSFSRTYVSMLLNADRPIEDVTEDALGVGGFAHALADSILRMVPSSGFVIALPGEWGSRQSSILYLGE